MRLHRSGGGHGARGLEKGGEKTETKEWLEDSALKWWGGQAGDGARVKEGRQRWWVLENRRRSFNPWRNAAKEENRSETREQQ